MNPKEVRSILLEHQKRDKKTAAIILQLGEVLDGGAQRRKMVKEVEQAYPGGGALLQQAHSRDRHSKLQLDEFRLNPGDGVLEARVSFVDSYLYLPYIPSTSCSIVSGKEVTWRRWLFDCAHRSFTSAHPTRPETVQKLKRMAI